MTIPLSETTQKPGDQIEPIPPQEGEVFSIDNLDIITSSTSIATTKDVSGSLGEVDSSVEENFGSAEIEMPTVVEVTMVDGLDATTLQTDPGSY